MADSKLAQPSFAAGVIASLRSLLKQRRVSQTSGIASEQPALATIPHVVQAHWKHYAWNKWLLRLLGLCIFGLVVAAGAVWWTASKLNDRPALLLRGESTLKQKAEEFYHLSDVTYDSVTMFVASVLPPLHDIDDGGYPLLRMVRGMVSTKVFEEARASLEGDLQTVRKRNVNQHLRIVAVEHIDFDEAHRRIVAYVKGYFVVVFQKGEAAPVFVPYRASVILDQNPPSKVNPSTYFLVDREERLNAAALAWDKEYVQQAAITSGQNK